MAYSIYIIFFLSGTSALIFETVWFRLAGLVFGNSVWSASLVLSGFMGGLAMGNALISRHGDSIRLPVRFYAGLEIVIAISGMTIVTILPLFEGWLTPIFRPFLEIPLVLNPLRLSIAFLMIMVPTTAMGATLPILVKALYHSNRNFGLILGQLYGWNTMGAVLGALVGEVFLIKLLGIRGTGLVAVFLNTLAALLALRVSSHIQQKPAGIWEMATAERPALSMRVRRLLTAAFLTGGILLALELVWFRFLLLFASGTNLAFAIMLSVVLAGIGSGGLIASWWYRRSKEAHRFLHALLLLGGIMTVIPYMEFHRIKDLILGLDNPAMVNFVFLAAVLILPVSIISGLIFTMLGRAVKEDVPSETRTAGMLIFLNTVGAMFGSFAGGFLLLPHIGMENSFFILAAGYGLTAIIVPAGKGDFAKKPLVLSSAFLALFILIMAFFPFGLMKDAYFGAVDKRYQGAERVAVRESLTETISYYRYKRMGKTFYHRLVTNGFSMSSSSIGSKRYMKLFVYLPVALNPEMKNALLVSYGVGLTAKALTDTRGLETIDIVDISKDILDMSTIVYPDPEDHPLNDKRVKTHIEDGRFFLRTTDRLFDLITSEPPPPKLAGIVNLYSQEYFDLIHNRLKEGGIVSYWLPGHLLYEKDEKAIIKAFCNVFKDCSLWAGTGLNWMLLGTRNGLSKRSEELFSRQWHDTEVKEELQRVGLETPEQLGSLFIADFHDLKVLTENSLPLTDNHPLRLSRKPKGSNSFLPLYGAMMEEKGAMERFQQSNFIKSIWPEKLYRESLKYFPYQRMYKIISLPEYRQQGHYEWEDFHNVLTRSNLHILPLWMMRVTLREIEISEMVSKEDMYKPDVEYLRAILAITERDFIRAVRHFEAYLESVSDEESKPIYPIYIYALLMAEENEKAAKAANDIAPVLGKDKETMRYWEWLNSTFSLKIDSKLLI